MPGREEHSRDESAARGRLVAAGVAAGAAALFVGVALLTSSGPSDFQKVKAPPQGTLELRSAVAATGCTEHHLPKEGDGETTEDVKYRSNPPHSGRQAPEPGPDGAYYDNPPDDEALVHTLRHGRVVIWFDPDLSEREKGLLKAVFDESPAHSLLVPRDGMPFEVAATAWRRRLGCRRMTKHTFDAIRAFRSSYRDRAPEFVR
jgi:Protein of unknown function (DUF3105)